MVAIIAVFILAGFLAIWITTLKLPDVNSIQDRFLAGSTKIYDRTGTILLYDLGQNVRQQVVPYDDISQNMKNATIAIEDEKFYQHSGIEVTSIIRALLADIITLHFTQGGSTITQQVVKNSLLTTDKTISRKIKEWVLSMKLEQVMTKDQILNLYLNGTSYGGNYYGVEEASENFFGTSSKNLDIAQSAYLAALPQAPSYYSPFGNNRSALDDRKNLVLEKMLSNNFITQAQYDSAKAEKVTFLQQQDNSIKAPHFVMFIENYLEAKYGDDMVKNGNLKVITTLDYTLQAKAEAIVKQYALSNQKKFNASNAAMTAIDPTTGQILVMVGSRDYFDTTIDGNFNVTLAHRQPGSAFKPFVYATAFNEGYTPDTVVFDVPTQFSTACDAYGNPLSPGADCYTPQNYDNKFVGPISFRDALAQSRNVPSIKVLYLAGIQNSITTAQDMGITSLGDANQYGLTLVLGGGEVSPLEMTSAYGVFADNGIRNPYTGILSVTDANDNVLEQYTANPQQVLPTQSALLINDVLSDNTARLPLNGPGSSTDFPDRDVALKTGTTNNYRDVWTIGYTPQIVVGAWAGNNDDTPMTHSTSGLIVAPMWRAFMDVALADYPPVTFLKPAPTDPNLKPVLRGIWQGNQTYTIDSSTGLLATDQTPANLRVEKAIPNVHSILYWVNKDDPTGPAPTNPASDPQYSLWEPGVEAWVAANGSSSLLNYTEPTQVDTVNNPNSISVLNITQPTEGSHLPFFC